MGQESVGLHTCRVRRGGLDWSRSEKGGEWFISVVGMLEWDGRVAGLLTVGCAERLQFRVWREIENIQVINVRLVLLNQNEMCLPDAELYTAKSPAGPRIYP